jgi:hypothetical protein
LALKTLKSKIRRSKKESKWRTMPRIIPAAQSKLMKVLVVFLKLVILTENSISLIEREIKILSVAIL